MKPDKIQAFIGLAMKAGKVAAGEFCTEKAVKSGIAFLVITAEDASENTKKKFSDMCKYYRVPFLTYSDKDSLGYIIGKQQRAMLAITDNGFASKLKTMIENK